MSGLANFAKAVFVIGSTAVGKTKLGIDLALRLNGEIVSTDSMQIYEKASLMTAKPSPEERLQVPHHLIDLLPLSKSDFTVREYQSLALNVVRTIESQGKTPIFVGGTLYYVESLLFDKDYPADASMPELSDEEIYEKLQQADPEYFKINDSNHRHIRNAYFYYTSTGLLPSARVVEQNLRFSNSVIIWLHCSPQLLEGRVRARIAKMIQEGGLTEIQEVLASGNNFTKGVLQSIGYKEFESYFAGTANLESCIDKLVLSTLQYSRKQVRWIKNRLEPFLRVHKICTDQAEDWDFIKNQAFEALDKQIEQGKFLVPKVESRVCALCQVTLRGSSEWSQHIKSKSHKKKKEGQVEDDEESRLCEVCEKEVLGMKNWLLHLKSKKHLRRSRKTQPNGL